MAPAQGSGLPFALGASTNGTNGARSMGVTVARFAAGPPAGEAPGRPAFAGARHEPSERELLAKRDRLIERFAAMQLDLGGVYYEMAIRDHIAGDVLIRKAAEMQRVDAELRQVEASLQAASRCPACDTTYAPGAVFCSQCGTSLATGGKQTER